MIVPLVDINRIKVVVHPGQLEVGNVHLVALHDGTTWGREALKSWEDDHEVIVLYDGPPQDKVKESQLESENRRLRLVLQDISNGLNMSPADYAARELQELDTSRDAT